MAWSSWRKLADKGGWYDDTFDWDGPACYELGIAGPRGGDPHLVYVGETSNEARRMKQYAADGSHLSDIIHDHLRRGWTLWYRGRAFDTKDEAVQMQNRLLKEFEYDWNVQRNADEKEFY